MKTTRFDETYLDDVAALHMWAFKDHLNVLLGKRYIKAFLQWFVHQETCVNIAGINDRDTVAGYVVGAPWGYQAGMNRSLLKVAAIEMLKRPWIFFHAKILKSVWLRLKTMLGMNRFIETTREKYSGKIISLVGIGVAKDDMGTGMAALLMEQFIREATDKGYDYARLSVYTSNARARKFYEKMGWLPEHSQTAVMGYYKKLR